VTLVFLGGLDKNPAGGFRYKGNIWKKRLTHHYRSLDAGGLEAAKWGQKLIVKANSPTNLAPWIFFEQ